MKIKIGFVTNSSSSSFLVVWPSKIKDVKDVSKYINDPKQALKIFNKSFDFNILDPENDILMNNLCDDIINGQTYVFIKFMLNKLGLTYNYHFEKYFKDEFIIRHRITKQEWDNNFEIRINSYREQRIFKKKFGLKFIKEFALKYKGSYIYKYYYEDGSEEYYIELEHSNSFVKLPYIYINNH